MEEHRFSKSFIVSIGILALVSTVIASKLYTWNHPQIHYLPVVKVTLREGLTNKEMADTLSRMLKKFDKNTFLEKSKNEQGHLFPDTYLFNASSSTQDVIGIMHMNFNKKLKSLDTDIHESAYTLRDSIIMASIIEKEAHGPDDAATISGILWKRLSIGMPLQVDIDRTTYAEKGLPLAPISNPGFIAIKAALHPAMSPYLYYLHDKNGTVHYAENYAIHKKNIAQYLK